MTSPRITLAFLLAVVAIGDPICAAVPPQPSSARQVSMTRPMLIFFQLEQDLATAISKHDTAATDALLSADFELRPDQHPGEPTARADWLAGAAAQEIGAIEQLGVRDYGDVAIVSYVRTTPSANAATVARSYVIDAWTKSANNWQLITRYQSELPSNAVEQQDVAPTGKG